MRNLLTSALVLVFTLASHGAFAEDSPGKKLFLANRCNKCHKIDVEGVKRLEEPEAGKTVPPDLSGVGNEGDADWISKFVTKQEKSRTKNNKLHQKKFGGTPEELKTLADWLGSLKTGNPPSKQ